METGIALYFIFNIRMSEIVRKVKLEGVGTSQRTICESGTICDVFPEV